MTEYALWMPVEYIGEGYFLEQEYIVQVNTHPHGSFSPKVVAWCPALDCEGSKRHEGAHKKTLDSINFSFRISHIEDMSSKIDISGVV